MATPPTFTSGAVLTAAQMNAVGLWKVASGPLSSTATNFVGCFTSEYRNYRIVVETITLSASSDFCWQGLVGTTAQTASNYWVAGTGLDGSGGGYNQNQAAGNPGRTLYTNSSIAGGLVMDIIAPQIAGFTVFTSQAAMFQSDNFRARSGGGAYNQTTQLTGIRFLSAGGQTIGGNVTIYGYN